MAVSCVCKPSGWGAEAGLQVTYERPDATRPDAVDLPLLRALVPSFRMGLDALARFDGQRAALDAVTEPIAVFDADDHAIHRNGALVLLFDKDSERERVVFDLRVLTRTLRGLAFRDQAIRSLPSRRGG